MLTDILIVISSLLGLFLSILFLYFLLERFNIIYSSYRYNKGYNYMTELIESGNTELIEQVKELAHIRRHQYIDVYDDGIINAYYDYKEKENL